MTNGFTKKLILFFLGGTVLACGAQPTEDVAEKPKDLIALTAPPASTYTSSGLTLTGTCKNGLAISLGGTGLASPTSAACANGSFSIPVSFTTSDGVKAITLSQTEGTRTTTVSRNFIKDSVSPIVDVSSPADGSNQPASMTMTGSCESGLQVVISGSGVASSSTAACTSGAYSAPITFSAGDGAKSVSVTQTDAAGNATTVSRNYMADATFPILTITGPAANTSAQNGVTLTGACETGLTVNLSGAGLASPSSTTCSASSYSVAITFTSGDGTKNIVASQTDLAGNITSTNRNFIKDTTAPTLTIASPAANAEAQTGVTLAGACETGLTVNLSGAGLSSPSSTTCSASSYSVAITFTAGDGTKNIIATQTDAAGNSTSVNRNFIRDTVAPTLTIASPAANTQAQNGVTLTGTCETGLSVNLSGTGLASPSSTTCSASSYSVAITFTAGDGTKNIVTSQSDAAGNTASANRNFTKDTTAPTLSITGPAANTLAQTGVTLTGACETGLPVNFSGTGLASPSSTTCSASSYSVAITFTGGDGTKNIVASQTDAAGNTASSNRNFIKDATAPNITIASPTANTEAQSGVTISGACETGLTVNLSGAGLASPSSTTCSASSYSVAITFTAGDGTKNIVASQTDSVGNAASANRDFIKDTTPPSLTIASPAANTSASAGLTLTGACETGLAVSLSGTGLASPSSTACSASSFSVTITFTSGDGTKNIVVSQTDAAGNAASANRDFIRSSVPVVTITSPAANTEAQNGVTIAGACENGLSVDLGGAGLASPSSTTCSGGAYSVAVIFSAGDGTKNIVVSQTNLVPQTGSANQDFIKDTTAPNLTIASPAANTSAQTGVTLTGACETGLTVNLSGAGLASPSSTTCSASSYSVAITFTAGDGTKNIVLSQTDAVGNVANVNRNFIKDTVAPTLTIASPAANTQAQTGVTLTGACETGLTVNLSGTGLASPSSTTCSASSYSVAVTFTAGDGTKNIVVDQTDAAGNAASANRNFVKDSTAPNLTITGPAANTSAQTGVTLTGACETGLTVNLSGTGLASPSSTTCSASSYSVAITFTAGDGNKNIVVAQTDSAGNSSTTNRNFVKDTTAPTLTITSPVANTSAQTGVTLTGACETGLTVNLSGTGLASPSSTTCSASSYSVAITFTATDGTKNIVVAQTDAAGNSSTTNRNFTKDTTAPALPTLSSTTPVSPSNVTIPTVTGTAEANSSIQLFTNNTCTTAVEAGTTSGGGSFNINVSVSIGTTTYWAKATDAAGNVSGCSTSSIAYQAYAIGTGLAWLYGTDTTAPTTPTNFNQATAYSIKYSTSEFDSSYYSHSRTTNSHQLTVSQNGHYFVSVTVPVNAALANAALRTEVRVNGTAYSGSVSESSYIENAGSLSESSNHVALLLSNLTAGDIIDVVVSQGGAAGTVNLSGQASLYVENVSNSRKIFTGTATQTTNSTNLNQATAYSMRWTEGVETAATFSHSDATNPENITLLEAGHYLIYVNIPLEGAVTQGNVKMSVQLGGVTIAGGEAKQGRIRNSGGHTHSSLHFSGYAYNVTANSVLTITTTQEGAAGTIAVSTGKVGSIFVEKLNSAAGVYFGRSTRPVGSTSWNAAAADPLQWANDDLIDNLYFSHSTSTNSQNITIQTAGDYQLIFNDALISASARVNAKITVAVNGVALTGAETKTNGIRNTSGLNEASASLVYLLRNLSVNDVVTVRTIQEASAGSITSNTDSLLVLIHKP